MVGFFSNLFYPFFAGMSLAWLTLTVPLQVIIPPLGAWMHSINNQFTEALLNLAYHLPPKLQLPLQLDVAGWVVVFYVTVVSGCGVLLHQRAQEARLREGI